ncbi:hypothetical protein OUZ56_033875 [Daphnia magna]|uniref:Helicase ATP-binding domain-containing protein n=1 Tax=Daphnia magna TaxID=35525 RepID=A0ABQ9ZYB8_9CRUS|nr:hypothetical protein OUZ56_033875 [Daphnia magna]
MEHQVSESTLLTYLTTGCLLEALVAKKSLEGYTHIIIDEVHERDEDTDFLLLVVRKFLRHTRTTTKVFLMSVTFDADKFGQYFNSPVIGNFPFTSKRPFRNAPIIEVEHGEPHDIRVYYSEHLQKLEFLGGSMNYLYDSVPEIHKLKYDAVAKLISAFDGRREIQRYGRHPKSKYKNISSNRSAILIFLPGVCEIENMHKALLDYDINSDFENCCLAPHFSNFRKIILSTNIAEKSLTVPDVTYVIDFCLIKELVTDPDTNLSRPVGRIPPTSADYYSAGYTIKPPPQCKRENGREPDSNDLSISSPPGILDSIHSDQNLSSCVAEKSRSSSLIESLLFHGAATSAECGKLMFLFSSIAFVLLSCCFDVDYSIFIKQMVRPINFFVCIKLYAPICRHVDDCIDHQQSLSIVEIVFLIIDQ